MAPASKIVSDTFLESEFSMQNRCKRNSELVQGIVLLISLRLANLEPVENHIVFSRMFLKKPIKFGLSETVLVP